MPPVVVTGAALVTLYWTKGVSGFVNVLGASKSGGTTINQALADTLATNIRTQFTNQIATHISPTVTLQTVGIRDISSANLAEYRGAGVGVAGTGTGDPLPLQNAVCVTIRTGRAGQSFRGRVYLAGWTEAANDTGGSIATTVGTAAVAFVTACFNAMTTAGLPAGIVSRPSERVTVVTTTFHSDGTQSVDTEVREARTGQVTPVTTAVLRNSIWDTQRRRAAPGSASSLFMPPVAEERLGLVGSTQELQYPDSSR